MNRNACAFTGHRPHKFPWKNGEQRGGTAATVRYARKLGREILIIDPISLESTYSNRNLSERWSE